MDFSHVKDRIHHGVIPWDYDAQAQELLGSARSALDMGTGGGERLARFNPLPKKMVATEGYRPNVPIAQQRLEPLGVTVIGVDDMQNISLPTGSFDLIINHHTEYSLANVYSLLSPDGIFFTQQVTGENLDDLERLFDCHPPWHDHNVARAKQDALATGFVIEDTQDWHGHVLFEDVGAVVYFLKAIPWIVDDFSVEKHQDYLFKLQERLECGGKLEFSETRFLLKIRKPQ